MKIKKVLPVLVSMAVAFYVLAGCGEKKHPEDLEIAENSPIVTASPEIKESESSEQSKAADISEGSEVSGKADRAETKAPVESGETKSSAGAVRVDMRINTKDEFIEKAGKLLNLSEYDIYSDGDSVSYSIKYDNAVDYDFDYTVRFNDGSAFTLPVKYSDMTKAGWSTDIAGDTQVSNMEETDVVYTNSKGNKIFLSTSNLSAADDDTEKKCSLKDCLYYSLGMEFYSKDLTEGSDGKLAETYVKGNAPGITVCGNITDESSVSDIISVLGKPSVITFYEGSKRIWLQYNDDVEKWYSSLSFDFSSESGYMNEMEFEYSYADAKMK